VPSHATTANRRCTATVKYATSPAPAEAAEKVESAISSSATATGRRRSHSAPQPTAPASRSAAISHSGGSLTAISSANTTTPAIGASPKQVASTNPVARRAPTARS
jgi:hypothetical protein